MSTHLVFGASGLLGKALLRELRRRGRVAIGASRHGPDYILDLTESEQIESVLAGLCPDVVWNAAAIVNLAECEADPCHAYCVNARAVAMLSAAARKAGAQLVHVSTDHFFTGDRAAKHSEDAPVQLLNEYARTKFAGERFALLSSDALVLRTNITGFRGQKGQPTFAEWVFDVVRNDAPIVMFDDFFTSTLDVASFSRAACDLVDSGAVGLLNLAASEVAHKKAFIEAVAERMGRTLTRASTGSVQGLIPRRAESLGLDIGRAERLLGYPLPGLGAVVETLVNEYRGIQ